MRSLDICVKIYPLQCRFYRCFILFSLRLKCAHNDVKTLHSLAPYDETLREFEFVDDLPLFFSHFAFVIFVVIA